MDAMDQRCDELEARKNFINQSRSEQLDRFWRQNRSLLYCVFALRRVQGSRPLHRDDRRQAPPGRVVEGEFMHLFNIFVQHF